MFAPKGEFMKASLLFLSTIATIGSVAMAAPEKLTRELLLKNSPVPERREFPLSKNINACQDFHKYVCDEVEKNFTLPADRSRWNFSFTDNAERLLAAKKNYFLWLESGGEPQTKRAKPIKNFYLACMNEKASADDEKKFVEEETKQFMSLKNVGQLADLMQKRVGSGDFTWYDMGSDANQQDPLWLDSLILTSIMTLPERSYYQNAEALKDLKELAQDFFTAIKATEPEKKANAVVELEKAFAMIHPVPAEMRQRWAGNFYSDRSEWIANYPNLKLKRLMDLPPKRTKFRNVVPESFKFLNDQVTEENFEDLRSLLLFRSISPKMDDAYPEHFKKRFAFSQKHLGAPAVRPVRQERCTTKTMGNFMMELDHELIPILFPGFPGDKVVILAEKIRSSIKQQIEANKWLSPEGRKEALNKIALAKLYLVKPRNDIEWNFNPILKFSATNPIKNQKELSKALFAKELKELREKRKPEQWWLGPLTLNAYYSPSDNKFVLLQGILQYPFFDNQQTEIENLGAIGAVVGHELGHGIDDQGARYDSAGRVHQWMTEGDLAEFKKRGEIFVKRLDKINHNGALKLGEVIGDHVGITSAYKAAFPDPSKATVDDQKLFFVAYARMWCNKALKSAEEVQIRTAPHPLGAVRINEQVVHLPAFAKAFSCKKGDKMFLDPKEQGLVW